METPRLQEPSRLHPQHRMLIFGLIILPQQVLTTYLCVKSDKQQHKPKELIMEEIKAMLKNKKVIFGLFALIVVIGLVTA